MLAVFERVRIRALPWLDVKVIVLFEFPPDRTPERVSLAPEAPEAEEELIIWLAALRTIGEEIVLVPLAEPT